MHSFPQKKDAIQVFGTLWINMEESWRRRGPASFCGPEKGHSGRRQRAISTILYPTEMKDEPRAISLSSRERFFLRLFKNDVFISWG